VTDRHIAATQPAAAQPAEHGRRANNSCASLGDRRASDTGVVDIGDPVDHADQHGSDPASTAAGQMDPLVQLIQSEPGMAERLLDAHRDDGTGRCRVCSTGAQTGRARWPCTLHHHAHQAHQQSSHPIGPPTLN
jgi:hypothetical protein